MKMMKRLLCVILVSAIWANLLAAGASQLPSPDRWGLETEWDIITRENPFAALDRGRIWKLQSAYGRSGLSYLTGEAAGLPEPAAESSPASEGSREFIVKFKDSVALETIAEILRGYRFSLVGESSLRLFSVFDEKSRFQAEYGYLCDFIQENTGLTVSVIPNDSYYSDQWALAALRLPAAWDVTKGSEDISVAVIDTGFYRYHEDFNSSTVKQGYDFVLNRAGVTGDPVGHGTNVISVIGAATDNGRGIAGANWNISVVPMKVAQSNGDILSVDVVEAIIYAADLGCDVINLSLGAYDYDLAMRAAVEYAVGKGCIIVAAAGNEGAVGDPDRGKLCYPASFEGVISAAAVSESLERAGFSQYNRMVDVAAPGENILVAGAQGSGAYAYASGTSFASPYVAAVAALARSVDGSINAAYFEELVALTSVDAGAAGKDSKYGWGLLDAEALVKEARKPIVLGVSNNSVYTSPRTIQFNGGTAVLSGTGITGSIPFASGQTVYYDGLYTLVVRKDDGYETTVSFRIDTGAPSVSGVTDGGVYNRDVTITFTGGRATLNGGDIHSGATVSANGSYTLIFYDTDGNPTTIRFTIDKAPPVVSGVENNKYYNTNRTITFNEGSGLLDGKAFNSGGTVSAEELHTLTVTDAAQNTTTVRFTIDKKAPVVSGVENNKYYNTNRTVTFSEGSALLNGKAFNSGGTVSAAGQYTLAVTDLAGNQTRLTFFIDKTLPKLSARTGSNAVLNHNGTTKTDVVVAASDNNGSVSLSATRYGKSYAWPGGGKFTADGYYVVTATDKAGNKAVFAFSLDKSAPGIACSRTNGSLVGNGGHSNTDVRVSITDATSCTKTVRRNGGTIAWPSNSVFTKEGKYTLTVKDRYGRVSTYVFYIDKTAPVIKVKSLAGAALKNGGSVAKGAKITCSEKYYGAKALYYNGKKISWPSAGKVTAKGSYSVTVTDKAGNKTTFAFRVT